MSTNATIKIKCKDGTENGVYLHWDGYIEYAGVMLQLHYNTADKIKELIALGNLSSLGEVTTSKNEVENGTIAYHRDRGEGLHFCTGDNEFVYTFDELNNVWYVTYDEYTKNDFTKKLGLTCEFYKKNMLLIEAISNCDTQYVSEDEIKLCIEKAVEARQDDIDTAREADNAYYIAYCS